MTNEPTTQEKTAGLARIRDNQRRSRARRKEYITELEDKNKYCEQLGVEASIELQAAARLVMNENQRLRALLRRIGYSDADIDRECSGEIEPSPGAVVQDLLGNRRSCRPSASHTTTENRTSEQSSTIGFYPTMNNTAGPQSLPIAITSKTASSTANESTTAYASPPYGPNSIASEFDQVINPARSCRDAAGMLRSVHPDLGQELEEQLGCGHDQNDCNVSNDQIFQVLDRYG